jgi:D-alanyl-D-alanine carboxypeptidase/D-alanyl-D-alanine-endopeptidase (penicillin-binding protein 4)
MMHRSDNFFAEQSLLMVSREMTGHMSDEQIIDSLLKTDFHSLPQPPRWVDGSGLSRYNLFSPRDLVSILDTMMREFGITRLRSLFPSGNQGTLRGYYTSGTDYIFAKTGSLSGVVALSGFLYTKRDRLLLFSVLVNNHNGSASDIRRAVEKLVEAVRADL